MTQGSLARGAGRRGTFAETPGWYRPYLVLLALAALVAALSLAVGHADLADADLRATLLKLRAQRLLGAFLAGTALAVAGVLVQGLFQNPLASPSVIGTSAGASFGGRLGLLATLALPASAGSWPPPQLLLPAGSVLGALGALALLLAISRVRDDLVVLLLSGFLLSSLFLSLEGFVTSLALERWELARAVVSFALGDVSAVGLPQLLLAAPLVMIGAVFAWSWSAELDLMLSGEEEARSLGADARRLRRWVVVWTAVLTAAAVAIGGNIGFVGLVVPHALRPFVGVLHRRLIPAAALGGGTFVVACDILCRVLPGRTDVPLGVVTGLIGAPVFLWLLLEHRGRTYLS